MLNDVINSDAYQAVEIRIPANTTGTVFQFNDLPYLRPGLAEIVAVEAYTLASIATGPVSGIALAPLSVMQKSFLTIYGNIPGVKQGNQIIQSMPLLRLNNMRNATPDPFSITIMKLNNIEVDWTKSFVSMSSGPGNVVDNVLAFGIYFNFKK